MVVKTTEGDGRVDADFDSSFKERIGQLVVCEADHGKDAVDDLEN